MFYERRRWEIQASPYSFIDFVFLVYRRTSCIRNRVPYCYRSEFFTGRPPFSAAEGESEFLLAAYCKLWITLLTGMGRNSGAELAGKLKFHSKCKVIFVLDFWHIFHVLIITSDSPRFLSMLCMSCESPTVAGCIFPDIFDYFLKSYH